MINDTTIIAPATTLINQAISIIRVSGPETYKIINKVFSKKVTKPEKNKIVYGYIKENIQVVDEVLLMCYKKPYSFTGEDMIEINCHGGVLVTKKIINLIITKGAILAKRGEFSKRAFLNGKLNLVQADSINNLITSTNETALQFSINTILGKNFKPILKIRQIILDLIANVEVNIDYPEYDGIGDLTLDRLKETITKLILQVSNIVKLSKAGKLINDGINTVIVGKPNVGKSSFLNALLNEEKAIVSEWEGTTRDLVEGKINIEGITLNLIDTAGMRKTDNFIEKKGIEKTKNSIKKADLVLVIFDASKKIDDNDKKILELTKSRKRIIIQNKCDIKLPNQDLKFLAQEKVINVSAMKREILPFLEHIKEKFFDIELLNQENLILVNLTYINILSKILSILKLIYGRIDKEFPVDILNINLREIWHLLGKLLGEEYEESILDKMFNNYCLGK